MFVSPPVLCCYSQEIVTRPPIHPFLFSSRFSGQVPCNTLDRVSPKHSLLLMRPNPRVPPERSARPPQPHRKPTHCHLFPQSYRKCPIPAVTWLSIGCGSSLSHFSSFSHCCVRGLGQLPHTWTCLSASRAVPDLLFRAPCLLQVDVSASSLCTGPAAHWGHRTVRAHPIQRHTDLGPPS